MRRTFVHLGAATSLVLGVAGPAAAAPPIMDDHDCRVTFTQCNPGLAPGLAGCDGSRAPRTCGG